MLCLLAVAAAEVASPLLALKYPSVPAAETASWWDLSNGYDAFSLDQYEKAEPIVYSETPATDCDGGVSSRISAGALKDRGLGEFLCSEQKLGVPTLDSGDSPALCGNLTTLQELCKPMEDCHSVTFQNDLGNRGYLNTFVCAVTTNLKAEPTSSVWVKSYEESLEDCVLGYGAEIIGGPYPEVRGVYAPAEWGLGDSVPVTMYEQISGTSIINGTSCGFTVFRTTYKPPPVPVPAPGCTDKDDLVNMLFGTDVTGVCAEAAAWYGAGSYCSNPTFAALCSVTCGTDCKVDAAFCDTCMGPLGSAVYAAACPETCGGRRLTEDPSMHGKLSFRAAMKDAVLDARQAMLHGHQAHAARERRLARERNLEWEAYPRMLYEEVYTTFDPLNASDCTDYLDSMPAQGLFDVLAYHAPLPITLDLECPGNAPHYSTKTGLYCSNNNHPVLYTKQKELHDHSCFEKCSARTREVLNETTGSVETLASYMNDTILGLENDWCSGWEPSMVQETDALCLPRERCEELCTMLGDDCTSFDMHVSLPRCYLNLADECPVAAPWGAAWQDNFTVSSSWTVVYKDVTPDETTNASLVGDRDLFLTYTGRSYADCDPVVGSFDDRFAGTVTNTREVCEATCRQDPACTGFYMVSVNASGTTTCEMTRQHCSVTDSYRRHDPSAESHISEAQLVLKVPAGVCTLEVTSDVDEVTMFEDFTLTGLYTKQQFGTNGFSPVASEGTFLNTVTNMTRFKYYTGVASDKTCDGWELQINTLPEIEVTLVNCTDNPPLAKFFLNKYATAVTSSPKHKKEDMDHPCQWGSDEGWCSDDVFKGLCAHTCGNFSSTVINKRTYLYQFNDVEPMAIYGAHVTHSVCDGDNNRAAYYWLTDYKLGLMKKPGTSQSVSEATACDDIAGANYTDPGSAFCSEVDTKGVLAYLCKVTCKLYPPVDPTITGKYVDEVSKMGSLYNSPYIYRQLGQETETWFEDRKLQVSGYTTSSAGMQASAITVKYIDGSATDDNWFGVFQTWQPGAALRAQPYSGAYVDENGTMVNGTICMQGTPGPQMYNTNYDGETFYKLPEVALQFLEADTLYNVHVPKADVELKSICRGRTSCPKFGTCVLSPLRFQDEFGAAFSKGWIPSLNISDLDTTVTEPKVLISEHRATAVMAAKVYGLGSTVMRNALGATRATLAHFTNPPDCDCYVNAIDAGKSVPEDCACKDAYVPAADRPSSIVLSLVSPTAAGGYYAEDEYLTTYPDLGATLGGYLSDVLRVEVFNDAGPTSGTMDLSIYVGDVEEPSLLRVVKQPKDGAMELLTSWSYQCRVPPCKEEEKNVVITGVTLSQTDIFITQTFDVCKTENPCDKHAICTNTPMGPLEGFEATCACKTGYSGDGMTCALDPEMYTSEMLTEAGNMDYYIKISHMDPLTLGWRVKDIELYSDAGCEGKLSFKDVGLAFPGPGDKSVDSKTTYDTITKCSNVFTGMIGYSHYPHPADMTPANLIDCEGKKVDGYKYYNGHLLDDDPATEWWSECLNCNPDTPTTIEFLISSATQLECIKIVQDETHYSSEVKIEKGPVRGEGCGMLPGMPRCEPYNVVIQSVEEKTKVVEANTTCGEPNTQIFGEVMMVAGTGWEGSYANNFPVESACHCHMLCVQHLDQGCRSWKYLEQEDGIDSKKQPQYLRHCYLQSNIFGSGTGWYGAASSSDKSIAEFWTSGTPAKRLVKNSVPLDKPFLLSVSVSPNVEKAVEDDSEMTITIGGAGLPFSEKKSDDPSELQRFKLVDAGASCGVAIPKEVSGISCMESVKTVTLLSGPVTTKVYTFCGPRPSATSATEVTFSGIKITRADEDKEYQICYCPYDCFEPSRWQVAPETIKVAGSVYTWMTTPEKVLRKMDDISNALTVTVTRPAFGSHSDSADWELKLIRGYYGCEVEMDMSFFGNSDLASSSCMGPDVCSWDYTLDFAKDEIGRFLVCFRQKASDVFTAIPSASGSKYIVVEKLDADYVHPRGIFHNQKFSLLSGSSHVPVSLDGSRMEIPTMGALMLTTGACGSADTYAFPGSIVAPEVVDVTPPAFVVEGSMPTEVGSHSAFDSLLLKFSEPVVIGDGCTGAFYIYKDAVGTPVETILCNSSKIMVQKNMVMLAPKQLADGDYFFSVDTGVVADAAGNVAPLFDSVPDVFTSGIQSGFFSFTVGAAADDVAPSVYLTEPADGGSKFDGSITFYFSEGVNVNTGSLSIVLCGTECKSTDPVIKTYTMAEGVLGMERPSLTFNTQLPLDGSRFMVTLPVDAVTDPGGNLGPAKPYVFEFVALESGFSVESTIRALPTSAEDSLKFSVAVADVPAGEYNMCYCSGQGDPNLEILGDGAYTYDLIDDTTCPGVERNYTYSNSTYEIMGFGIEEHQCVAKCSMGCLGPHCFCHGYSPESDQTNTTLCLPKVLCAEACSALDGCAGFVVHDSLPTCELLSAACDDSVTEQESFQFFQRKSGTACTHIADFAEQAGTVVVTERVHTAVDYVFTPGKPGSIEITAAGNATLLNASGGLTADRIMVIDCGGTCGVSSPTMSVMEPQTMAGWNAFSPYVLFNEAVHVDYPENPDAGTSVPTFGAEAAGQYVLAGKKTGYYVEDFNIDVTNERTVAAINGMKRPILEHSCYTKCNAGCTRGDELCMCDGYMHGYDTETSNAICADQTLCQYLCDQLDTCSSIDMHMTLPRCYLNMVGSTQDLREMKMDKSYKVLIKLGDTANLEQSTMYTIPLSGASGASILPVHDTGYSWEKMLRFPLMEFSSGGTFKLCFCDSSIAGVCKSEKDYSVEVGTIHSSGVSCLIAKEELQRVSCLPTHHGSSLRCYQPPMEAPNPQPPPIAEMTVLSGLEGAYTPDEDAGLPACPFGKDATGVCITA